jgi:hypothetical protein
MDRAQWSAPTTWNEVKARAAGRRRWNTTRRWRARMRRVQIAKRLTVLQREAWDRGSLAWMPRGVITQLCREFGVGQTTMHRDLKAIESWPAPEPSPKKRLKDPRFAWARKRTEHPLVHRITLRVPDELYQRLRAQGDVSRVIRQGVAGYLDTKSAHITDDCALVIAQACDPDTQQRLIQTAERLSMPIAEVLASLVHVGARPPTSPQPALLLER